MKFVVPHSVLGCIIAFLNVTSFAQVPSLSEAANRLMVVAKNARFSGEIALADRNGEVIDKVLGLADRETGRRHRKDAPWLWASVTKQVTAVLIMQQVESGKLSLDETIQAYLPEFSGKSGNRVTVRQLLQHLSGLPNPDDTAPDGNGVPAFYVQEGAAISDSARARSFCAGAPKAEPGAGFAYNNCDYLVLGAILERVTGKTYAVLVDEKIARPLGLNSMKLAGGRMSLDSRGAVGYTRDGKRYPSINIATFGAAGALTGTARNLIAFDQGLVAGKLLLLESRKILWQGDPELGYVALGVWSFPATLAGCKAPLDIVERRGDAGGVQVRNVIAPTLGRSIAIFTNDDTLEFGEVWQGKGLSHDLLSAAFCPIPTS